MRLTDWTGRDVLEPFDQIALHGLEESDDGTPDWGGRMVEVGSRVADYLERAEDVVD